MALVDTVIVSGPARQIAALQVPLRTHGIDLHVVLLHRRGRPESPYQRFLESNAMPHTIVRTGGPWNTDLLTALARTLRALQPDIVQTHGYRPTAAAFTLSVLGAEWAWLAFFHGETSENLKVRFYHLLDKTLARRAHRRVVMSDAQKLRLGPSDASMMVLHNAILPVSPRVATAAEAAASSAIGSTPRPRLGCVGRLSPEKGVDVFLHALAALAADGLHFSALIVGDGPELRTLKMLRTKLGLSDRVRFTGHLSSVDWIYELIDVVVLPSRSEGLPNTLLEALRADRPIVATSVGGIPEVVGGGAAAILVPSGDALRLAEGIKRALSAGHSHEARDARAQLCQAYSLEKRVMALTEIYGALSRPHP